MVLALIAPSSLTSRDETKAATGPFPIGTNTMSTNKLVYSTLLVSLFAVSVPAFQACRSHTSASTQMSDASITTSVKAKLIDSPEVKAGDVDVNTEEGTVYLMGRVGTKAEKAAAERIARSVDGVREVKNELKVGDEKS
jgi:hyperosmotically inducible periplasmic protein